MSALVTSFLEKPNAFLNRSILTIVSILYNDVAFVNIREERSLTMRGYGDVASTPTRHYESKDH